MLKKILDPFKEHAISQAPAEACALVVQVGRKQQLVICENTHDEPTEFFRISAEEWAAAEDIGDVVAVLHSHPGDGARPIASALDVQQCNASGVLWGIYAPDCDEYAEINPEQPSLIGRPFILGSDDCWGLIMAWHKTQGVELSDWRVNYPWWEDQYPENLYYDNWKKEGFVESDERPGCMVIMQVSANKWNHAGIITEDGQLLHHLYGHPSAVIPYAAGYFRDRTVICLRHKDLPEEIKPWKN